MACSRAELPVWTWGDRGLSVPLFGVLGMWFVVDAVDIEAVAEDEAFDAALRA